MQAYLQEAAHAAVAHSQKLAINVLYGADLLTRVLPTPGGSAPRSMASTTLTRHGQPGFHVRQTYANNIGAGTHKLGANDDGAELRVHFFEKNLPGGIIVQKTRKGPICKKVGLNVTNGSLCYVN
jgi:hypothetical protein